MRNAPESRAPVRTFGIRRTRYRRLAKTHLQQIVTAVGGYTNLALCGTGHLNQFANSIWSFSGRLA
jgi:hypothetical protein